MTKKGMDVPPFATEEHSPLKDLRNTAMDGSANLKDNQTNNPNTNDPKRKSVQSWYARMSDEKKAEYNVKRRTCVTSASISANTPQMHTSVSHCKVSSVSADTQVGVVTHHLQFLLSISLLLAIVGIINTEHQRQEPSGERGQENPEKLQLKVALEVVPGRSSAGSGLEERKRCLGRA
ncbi:hypothetical protein TRIUR3_14527 [Triticum urartu]|uniref:Uncharacterized protein n=1 Tax=Triticum urartu TaxID=4572 RepID=M8A057_TRIUA|nr:hypothetical protein TRIUR3_14527 [Triticum urartu]